MGWREVSVLRIRYGGGVSVLKILYGMGGCICAKDSVWN